PEWAQECFEVELGLTDGEHGRHGPNGTLSLTSVRSVPSVFPARAVRTFIIHRRPRERMPSIRVDGWRSGIRFDAAHVIPHHPRCGRLHGHTYGLHAEVHGDLDPRTGFVLDFGTVEQVLRDVADRLDHHVLVQAKSPHFSVIERAEGV